MPNYVYARKSHATRVGCHRLRTLTWGGGRAARRCLGVRAWMLLKGSDVPLHSSPPCLPFASLTLRDGRAPLLPWQSLGDIKGKQEKGYLEERVAKQPPPDPPPSTANPKLVPGLQPD